MSALSFYVKLPMVVRLSMRSTPAVTTAIRTLGLPAQSVRQSLH